MAQNTTQAGTVLLTPADVAHIARISRDTVYREISRGELRAKHVGGQLRVAPVDFLRWLERGHSTYPGATR
jgi:excisionase family DNA binding protein